MKAAEPVSVELRDRWVRVGFGSRGFADFELSWLRHRCDPADSSELDDDFRVSAVTVLDDALIVRWAESGRESRFPLRWLEENASPSDWVDDG